MKKLQELIEKVMDCEEKCNDYVSAVQSGKGMEVIQASGRSYSEGHRAACDVLVPALEEAIACLHLSGSSTQFQEGDYGYQFILIARSAEEKIRSLLTQKEGE